MLEFFLYLLFSLSGLLLIVIVLLQEGKGGGLGDAFGGAGAETFGVRAGGVNKVTFALFGVFVLSAMTLHWTSAPNPNAGSVLNDVTDAGIQQPAGLPGNQGGAGQPGDQGAGSGDGK